MIFPNLPTLPIGEALPALEEALAARRNVVLQAPPGAGKSTVVPLALLGSGWLAGRTLLMLEPRRIAARAVAQRMAHLIGETVGGTVGIRTRLETRVSRATRIEVVTEGILTRMLQSDPALEHIGCVVFDEFHERSLNADLGLALCLESQETLREDLRVLVMSATLETRPLSRLLNGAPIIEAHARSYEVTTHYVPRRPELILELQTAQVLRRTLADEGAAHPRRVPARAFRLRAATVRRARRGGSGCGDPSEPLRPAQDRARDQHRGDESYDRGRARGRRLGSASLCEVRSRHGDEPAGDGEAVAGRRRSAARTRRPAE
jgi:HrpA-like RNA helicase